MIDAIGARVAMARTSDPDSATSQFFINVVDNAYLDPSEGNDGYAVFGKVVSGMAVMDEISKTETDSGDKPLEDVILKTARME